MNAALTRLCSIPGNDDLGLKDIEDVLGVCRASAQRLISSNRIDHLKMEMGGTANRPRVRIPRAAVVRFIVKSSRGDQAFIFAAIRELCPQYLPAVADLLPGAAPLPANVIPMHGKAKPKAKAKHADFWHPNQLALFPEHSPGQASA